MPAAPPIIIIIGDKEVESNNISIRHRSGEDLGVMPFDDLLNMPEHLMKDFWMNPDIDPDALAKALRSYDEEVIKTVTDFLPKRKQAMFEPIDQPISKKELTSI